MLGFLLSLSSAPRAGYEAQENNSREKGGCGYALIENTKIFIEVLDNIASFMRITC
ncbi:hypothetical protein D1BOALGB6SA_2647 [Olavius sp. associated proteobacterium Delta 1]|nr:hypothetical protein D1BOALGB6SA_2647 [Olavius sp. associated proteobacterium Delta 1]